MIAVVLFVAIVLPSILPYNHGRARKAEIKQNLHAIQLAVERYASDCDGQYPYFLTGGDMLFNQGTVNYFSPVGWNGPGYWDQPVIHPFDMFVVDTSAWNYHDTDWSMLVDEPKYRGVNDPPSELLAGFGDALQFEGYLPKYPNNPFTYGASAEPFSVKRLGGKLAQYAGYGGRDGHRMWNLGYFGELPQLKWEGDGTDDVRLDFPGQFYYHPRWQDGVTNSGHLAYQHSFNLQSNFPALLDPAVGPGVDDSLEIAAQKVAGYDLTACGSPKIPGQDLDNSLTGIGTAHLFRTGYITLGQERNPYIPDRKYGHYDGTVTDFAERPHSDGIADFILIHLGSGLAGKVGTGLEN